MEKKRIVEKITLYIRYAVCVYNDTTVVRVREHGRARATFYTATIASPQQYGNSEIGP